MRTYTDLSQLESLEDRFEYLVLDGEVGYATFGYDRWANQGFYKSREWKQIRSYVITRDEGNDMGVFDFPVAGPPHIHHMNPLTLEDIEEATDNLFNPEYLVCVSQRTHNAIHYGDRSHLPQAVIARSAGDTKLW